MYSVATVPTSHDISLIRRENFEQSNKEIVNYFICLVRGNCRSELPIAMLRQSGPNL